MSNALFSEYKRDMNHNYLVLQGTWTSHAKYLEKITKHNHIEGLISYEERKINQKEYLYYQIDGQQTLKNVYEKKQFTYASMTILVHQIISIIQKGRDYLIKENDYILDKDYLFLTMPTEHASLCCFPDNDMTLRVQFEKLFEFFMERVDYQDQDAVYLAYCLHTASRQEDCTLEKLLLVLDVKKKERREEEFCVETKFLIPEKEKSLHKELRNRTNNENKKDFYPVSNNENKKDFYPVSYNENRNDLYQTHCKVNRKEIYEGRRMKQERPLPFIAEKNEEEQEIYYYPVKNYIILLAVIILFVVTLIVAVYYSFQEGIRRENSVKIWGGILLFLPIFWFIIRLLFRKEAKHSKMISVISYDKPERSKVEELYLFQKNSEKANALGSVEKEDGSLTDIREIREDKTGIRTELFEEEKTRLLSDYFKEEKTIVLHAKHLENYKDIKVTEFPFFIGKLAQHMDGEIDHYTISRIHAKITLEENSYYLYDLNSTNGTYVNGVQLNLYERTKINWGDEIRFADVSYSFIECS